MRSSVSAIMHRLFRPGNADCRITAFFTGKDPGADPGRISVISGIPREKVYMPIQKHTDKIIILESLLEPKIGDAVITREKGILIGVQAADCVPVLFHERGRNIIGAVHAGWRGTAAGILSKTLSTVLNRYRGRTEDISVFVGPSIRGCCYTVDHEVLQAVRAASGEGSYYSQKGGKYCLDLSGANISQVLNIGVPLRNIWCMDACTYCNPDQFYSYRYAKGPTGRQGGFIGILTASWK